MLLLRTAIFKVIKNGNKYKCSNGISLYLCPNDYKCNISLITVDIQQCLCSAHWLHGMDWIRCSLQDRSEDLAWRNSHFQSLRNISIIEKTLGTSDS